MSIVINASISNFGNEQVASRSNNKGSVDARNLKLDMSLNPVDEKKNSARKQALKLISDAWKNDRNTDKFVEELRDEKSRSAAELSDLKGKINKLEEHKKQLQKEYGVSDDSREQKDLLLLEKYQNNKSGASFDRFSDEELARLKELQGAELTEYQKRALEDNGAQGIWQIEADKVEGKLKALTASITDTEIERLKSSDMIKANKAAKEIMEAASKDAINIIMQEGMENIEDEAKETKEKADELREAKEERDEKLEQAKENRKEQEEILANKEKADILEMSASFSEQKVDNVAEAQKRINQILKDSKLINEDIKGIEIDLNF